MRNVYYSYLSYFLLIVVPLYILVGQAIISFNLDENNNLSFFTGPSYLIIRGNIMEFSLKTDVTLTEFQFNSLLEKNVKPLEPRKGDRKYEITKAVDWLTIKANEKNNLQNQHIAIVLADPNEGTYIKRRLIKTIKIDGKDYSAPYFYNKMLDHDGSNIKIYYAFYVFNLSHYMAMKLGNYVTFLITTLLLILFVCQTILFCISILWPTPNEIKEYFQNHSGKTINFVDRVSYDFSIPLGFLGTVTSIWRSLEITDIDYSSFIQMLEIIKIAIFTTVLGLAIKVICIIRGQLKGVSAIPGGP